MNILITGYTTRQSGSKRVQGDYVTFSLILEDILREMGHYVERRPILIGQELFSKYDFAFCGVAPLSSMSAGRICETHHCLDLMKGRSCIFADDWSFVAFGDSVRYTLDDRWDKYVKYKGFPYHRDVIRDTRDSLEQLVSLTEKHNPTVLAPMFPWGDHQYLMRRNFEAKLVTVDPSRWVKFPSVDILKPMDRSPQWIMAALSDHSAWVKRQGLKLQVHYVGNRRLNYVLTETQTVQLFANSYGVLSAGYPSAGSGWWRTRYLNAAWAESIIYSDSRDAATMGVPYRGDAGYFESMTSEHSYEVLAQAQNDWLQRNLSEKDTVKTILERLISK